MSQLSDYIRSQALWRSLKAEEYPEDERNAQSAAALEAFAAYIEDEDEDRPDWALEVLEVHLDPAGAAGIASPGEGVARATSRYGYGYAVSRVTHEAFLEELAELALADTYELLRDTAKDYDADDEQVVADLADTYGLHPWEVVAALNDVMPDSRYWSRRRNLTEAQQEEWLQAA